MHMHILKPNLIFSFTLLFVYVSNSGSNKSQKLSYTFTEFPYKENNKNEAMFREMESACEKGCLGKARLSKTVCVRMCISPSCYKDLYASDQLEEGEIDVRLNSFKGCFIQRYNRFRP